LVVSKQAAAANAIVDGAVAAGLDGSHPVTLQAKMLRLVLLKVKADLEGSLGGLRDMVKRQGEEGALERGHSGR
jgi:hypothetical protein